MNVSKANSRRIPSSRLSSCGSASKAASKAIPIAFTREALSLLTGVTADLSNGPVRYYAEVPKKAESTEAWMLSLASGGDGKSAQDVNPREPASTDAVQALMPLNVTGQQLR